MIRTNRTLYKHSTYTLFSCPTFSRICRTLCSATTYILFYLHLLLFAILHLSQLAELSDSPYFSMSFSTLTNNHSRSECSTSPTTTTRTTKMAFSTNIHPIFAYSRTVLPQHVGVGSILWLPKYTDSSASFICHDSWHAGHDCQRMYAEEGAYNHPVVVLAIDDQQDMSNPIIYFALVSSSSSRFSGVPFLRQPLQTSAPQLSKTAQMNACLNENVTNLFR